MARFLLVYLFFVHSNRLQNVAFLYIAHMKRLQIPVISNYDLADVGMSDKNYPHTLKSDLLALACGRRNFDVVCVTYSFFALHNYCDKGCMQ